MYGVRAGVLSVVSSGSVGTVVGEYFECRAASSVGEGGLSSVFDVPGVVFGGGGAEPPGSWVEAEGAVG